ncbi:zinc finger FYVE-type containing 26 spastizin isoform X1 [Leptinotarsa decemlineata]|uniref:zinc finger FYVE-type containing 26 spastizin isoform X1 n=1 Tax=Leptinotarsa decemlineata TaxID=7539 RepID=UPI003D307B10
MEEILRVLERLPKSEDHSKLTNQFYKKFSEYQVGDRSENEYLFEYVLPKINDLHNKNIIRKDILYLSLLGSNNLELLNKCMKFHKRVLELDIGSPTKLYDYVVYERQHWFKEFIGSSEISKIFDEKIVNLVQTLRFIELTNSSDISVDNVKNLLNHINKDRLPLFWQRYMQQVIHFIGIVEFCQRDSSTEATNEVFTYLTENSTFQTFSHFLDIKQFNWNEILLWLQQEDSLLSSKTQSTNFIAFSILGHLLNCLTKTPGLNLIETVNITKTNMLNIQDASLQIELLENIFALLFYEQESRLICERKETRLLIFLLKEILEEIKLKTILDKDSEEFSKLLYLNKLVTDGLWRMELIEAVKGSEKCEKYLLKYMLSSPESLIHMCLKQGDFERSFQVMKIFTLQNPALPFEIEYTESLVSLRDSLKKIFKIKAIHKVNPNISLANVEVSVVKTTEQFFKNHPIITSTAVEGSVNNLVDKFGFFKHFHSDSETFMNMLDLAITLSQTSEDCEAMLQLACENNTLDNSVVSSYSRFCKRLLDVCKDIGISRNIPAGEILVSPKYSMDLGKYKKDEEFRENLSVIYDELIADLNLNEAGYLNSKHLSHRSFIKLNKLCTENFESSVVSETRTPYLSKLYNYLKAFSKILYIEQNSSDIISRGKNTSFFDLLYHNRSELMGKLLFERNLDPSEFEKYFGKLKLDYLYHVVGNCFPTINLHTEENLAKDELYPENNLYTPSKSIISYIQKRNWLLAFILNEMYRVEGVKVDISEVRVKVFLNYLKLPECSQLKSLYNNNLIITALQNEISAQKLSDYANSLIARQDMMCSLHSSVDSFETGEELLEDTYKSTNWRELYDLVRCVPENQLTKNKAFSNLKDMILTNLIQDGLTEEFFKYVFFISNRDLRIGIILDHMKEWPGEFCMDVIKSEITKFEAVQDGKLVELKMWLLQIDLCDKLKIILEVETWYEAYKMCENEKDSVLIKLLEFSEINLLLDFISLHSPDEELLQNIDECYLFRIFQNSDSFEPVKLLLDALPFNYAIKNCYSLLKLLRHLDHLKQVTEYLVSNVSDDSLKNVQVSLKILSAFTHTEQDQLLCLIRDPVGIIEILVMNMKLDKLASVLNILKSEILHAEFSEDRICVEKIDEVLRTYAEKSLDFRVITQPNPRLLRTPEYKLLQSFDSLLLGADPRGFVMPDEVPQKADWFPNSEVLECMCCQKVAFSMFNRRHHCRRCGRVVCWSCSLHRMLVPTYGDILVRVCSSCYHQTVGSSNNSEVNDTMSTKSIVYDYWLLTDDPDHNKIVREEFSYEHAPSVSLCLSLMKYHSKTIEYPKFLLDQCHSMLKLLLPSQEPTQEIDYFLVIKMLKSLAMAAKMSSIECTLHHGTSLADRILSQADLLSLLAERGCLNLLPVTNSLSQGPYIDASVLRRLRDRLLEREQWNLALEVSTKAGLDNTGVFAVWGKSCLKAGSLSLAREKFQRCLDKTGHYESSNDHSMTDSTDNLTRSRNMSKTSNLSSLSETKPSKNPPLVNEIINILESNTRIIDPDVMKEADKQKLYGSTLTLDKSISAYCSADPAICIMNKLKNLKNISVGNYYQSSDTEMRDSSVEPPIHRMFYDECVYYLSRYGSHAGLLEFYVKQGDFSEALNYIIDNQLSGDVFIDIYMKCLEDGIIGMLQDQMSMIDSTLDVWKDYLLKICRHLEKQNMWHSLYQLQQFMGDYIRAAMTCIHFYRENAMNFNDLSSNAHFLIEAEDHLKYGLEQEQWVEVASVRRLSSASQASFEEKGIINLSMVMKISKKDVNKHINTIERQNEVVAFLAKCENAEVKPVKILKDMKKTTEESSETTEIEKPKIPTLFGSMQEKLELAVLAIVCGKDVSDGFNIALRIIQDYFLKPVKVYCEAGKQLAREERYNGIGQLVSCIKLSGGSKDAAVTDMCDEMLTQAVATFTKANMSGTKVEDLIKLIFDKATKISAYIEAKQLKTAYFLAVKYKRMSDIRRILREAELLNQPNIKALCQKMLHSHSHTPSHTKE